MEVTPRLKITDVMRARQAFHAVASLPAFEQIAVATYGEAADAPTTTAGPAAKIAAIWAKMSKAERDEFNRVLVGQVGEIPDTLQIDIGRTARDIVENAKGRPGRPDDFPGLREAVDALLTCWEDGGGTIQPGRLRTTDGRQYPGEPPLRPTPTVRFVAAGVLRAIPEHYRLMAWPDAKRRLLHECWRQVDQLHRARSRKSPPK